MASTELTLLIAFMITLFLLGVLVFNVLKFLKDIIFHIFEKEIINMKTHQPIVVGEMNLREAVETVFNTEELKNICFDLNVRYQDFPIPHSAFVRELLTKLIATDRLRQFLHECERKRPHIDWGEFY